MYGKVGSSDPANLYQVEFLCRISDLLNRIRPLEV